MTEIDRRQNLALVARKPAADLTTEEYFIWSQIKEGISLRELIPICPWPVELIMERVDSLIQKNSAEWLSDIKTSVRVKPETKIDIPPEIEAQLEKDDRDPELAKLQRSFRAEILLKYAEPETLNPYEFLGLSPRVTPAEAKERYLALSKKFHPDRFFNKNLGSYKSKLDTLFSRIQKAYAILKNPIEKEALDRTLQARAAKAAPNPEKKHGKLDKEMERFGRAESHHRAGVDLEGKKDFVGAYNSFVLAYQADPKREIFQKAMERVKPQMYQEKCKQNVEKIKKVLQTIGASQELVKPLEDSVKQDPSNPDAQLLLAQVILDLRLADRFRDAKEMLLRTKALKAKDPEPCYHLSRAFHLLGDDKAANKEAQEALHRNPEHAPTKKFLEKLK